MDCAVVVVYELVDRLVAGRKGPNPRLQREGPFILTEVAILCVCVCVCAILSELMIS